MAVKVTALTRKFKFKGKTLNDIDPAMSVEEVRAFYQGMYPDMLNTTIQEVGTTENSITYEFKAKVGSHG